MQTTSSRIIDMEITIERLEAENAKLKEVVARAALELNSMLHKEPDSDFTDIDDVIFDLEGIAGTRPELVLEDK